MSVNTKATGANNKQQICSYFEENIPEHQIPKKRGGFQIMSVTDDNESTGTAENSGDESVDDEDQSLDEKDENHTNFYAATSNFNDSSYSITHNEHVFLPAATEHSVFHNGFSSHPVQVQHFQCSTEYSHFPHEPFYQFSQFSNSPPHEVTLKSRTNSFNPDGHPSLQHNSTDATNIKTSSTPLHHETSYHNTQHTFFPNHSQELCQYGHGNLVPSISNSSISTSTRTAVSASATPSKTVSSRVYKVVKPESIHPSKKEISRWTYYDFSDIQTPNLAFFIHSFSDSRSSFHDPYHTHFSSSFSQSNSAIQFSPSSHGFHSSDVHFNSHSNGVPSCLNGSYNSSNSSSSLNHDSDHHKIYRSLKPIFENAEFGKRRIVISDDSRVSEASNSDQDTLKSAAQHSDTASNPEYEDESAITSNFRIDNKIEAAMDLVKKHLMLAVRDEVDELKERIYDLQIENETMKNLLTSDQLTRLQQRLNRSHNAATRPSYHTQLSYCQASSLQKNNSYSFKGSKSLSYQHSNHVGNQVSIGSMPPGQVSNNPLSNLRTSTVFSHHQTGSHSPKLPQQPLSAPPVYPQGLYHHYTQERTQVSGPTHSAQTHISSIHNNFAAQHYPATQMPNPSVINSTIPHG